MLVLSVELEQNYHLSDAVITGSCCYDSYLKSREDVQCYGNEKKRRLYVCLCNCEFEYSNMQLNWANICIKSAFIIVMAQQNAIIAEKYSARPQEEKWKELKHSKSLDDKQRNMKECCMKNDIKLNYILLHKIDWWVMRPQLFSSALSSYMLRHDLQIFVMDFNRQCSSLEH